MKTKLVLWGRNAQDERVLIALQLRPQDNKVDLWTFPETIATEDFSQKMLNEWRNGSKVEFPEGFIHSEKELSITESLLPEDLKVERGDLVQRAQTEWHFMVLSSKLNETYQTELQEIKEKVAQLSNYSGDVWEELKGFWAKVQTQVRDRNLFREHANDLRDNTNELFGKMKELRKSLDKEFQSKSEEHMNMFKTGLGEIKDRLEKGLNLNGIFEDLKKMQRDFKETKLSRDHRSTIWEQLDGLFKEVKNKRYGGESTTQGGNSTPSERLKRRYDGLLSALGKMEQSINRDKREFDFQDRKAEQSGGQLEAQLREAKIMMIKERIRSKEEKLNEMLQTKAELEKRIEVQTEKDARRAEQDKVREAKAEAAQKIKAKIKEEEAARAGDAEKLKEAAEKLKGKKQEPAEESIVEKITTEIEETLEDMVDTVKAVAHVVNEKIEEAIESFNAPEAAETPEAAEEKTEETPAAKTEEVSAEPAKVTDSVAKDELDGRKDVKTEEEE